MESRVYQGKSGSDKTKAAFHAPSLPVISLDTFHPSTQTLLNLTIFKVLR